MNARKPLLAVGTILEVVAPRCYRVSVYSQYEAVATPAAYPDGEAREYAVGQSVRLMVFVHDLSRGMILGPEEPAARLPD